MFKKLLDEDKSPVTLLTGIAPSVVATEPNNMINLMSSDLMVFANSLAILILSCKKITLIQ